MRRFHNQIDTRSCAAGVGKFIEFPFGGTLCILRDATAPFDLEFDDWGKAEYEAGFAIDTGDDKFKTVRCYNKSATEALYVSASVGTGSGTPGVRYFMDKLRPTRPVTSNPLINANDGVTIAGVNAGSRRRNVIITAPHQMVANSYIYIYQVVNGVVGNLMTELITPGQQCDLPTDADLHVWFAAAGGQLMVPIAEFYYR